MDDATLAKYRTEGEAMNEQQILAVTFALDRCRV
jgi:hypothetical protein